jgi:hypothetical protein
VRLRILVGADGKIVEARSPSCTGWARATRKQRRREWHPRLCVEVLSGPEALRYEALQHWGAVRWSPHRSGTVAVPYLAHVESRFRLSDR